MLNNSQVNNKKFCIIGGGLVGPLLSIFLAQRGISSDIYDKRTDIRETIIGGGRSIDMSLSHRGWQALDKVGLHDKVHSVNRKALNSILLDRAEETGLVNVFFNRKCEDIKLESGEIIFSNSKTKEKIFKKYDRIIGADGMFSKLRSTIALAMGAENGLTKHDGRQRW
jgi:kynurenine 3-monooxygenase